jgi:hypothetical protein
LCNRSRRESKVREWFVESDQGLKRRRNGRNRRGMIGKPTFGSMMAQNKKETSVSFHESATHLLFSFFHLTILTYCYFTSSRADSVYRFIWCSGRYAVSVHLLEMGEFRWIRELLLENQTRDDVEED